MFADPHGTRGSGFQILIGMHLAAELRDAKRARYFQRIQQKSRENNNLSFSAKSGDVPPS
jgi:hypothetical protein